MLEVELRLVERHVVLAGGPDDAVDQRRKRRAHRLPRVDGHRGDEALEPAGRSGLAGEGVPGHARQLGGQRVRRGERRAPRE